ncbi:glutamine--fructose-6-phosphate transaminase (isomerizing) [Neolewinella lacunae]|uniref:Glutamine--fructose-6-phosphate aminotransferase [isomerizing] n=1 Tax=Neolewinella lacunae TaxID=1517758 RepID=A0A923TCN6_9BACT|nr:glutamine--fructose-6-phosphate transaminase (isomerizing) [Neolewinella lacunae]MBC6993927.1 glutamine--fructose-6-phosphate transaminase (isomerizing) [Neolewinella lacunae]MDN3634992.1 glutamine--fructose-6-phosphate transaminase (isomerizing) [Neolewinella lacunae]
MCGIVGYIGHRQADELIIKGLERLEYRGYDSAGLAIINQDGLAIHKKAGKVKALRKLLSTEDTSGTIGIGHTRWATHGEPNDRNAHPHTGGKNRLALVHNGIIENYAVLKSALIAEGHHFTSDTDTEVLVHLIEEIQREGDLALDEAVRLALNRVEGAYAIAVIDRENPTMLVGARKASPLVVGIGEGEFFIGSDASPFLDSTKRVVYLDDNQIASISLEHGLQLRNKDNVTQPAFIQELDLHIEALEKEGYDHFMLKEIYEQPKTILDAMRGRISSKESRVILRGMEEYANRFVRANRIIIVACGTSYHSGLIGEYLIEDLARIPVEVEYASEFRYRNPIINEHDVVIAISQSGETADTLAALELAKSKGALIYGIVNSVGSSIARLTDAGSYIHCGPEIGVASTKAFTGQVTVLTLLALSLARKLSTISNTYFQTLLSELELIPQKVEETLKSSDHIKYIAKEIKGHHNALYLGRGYNFPVALEGALKLKEISYIHAEGYPAAEMKHGPIALIDENMPVIVTATNRSAYEKIVSNVQEVVARKGRVIAIVNKGEQAITRIADHVIEIPDTEEPFSPLLSVIPLQLLSYYIAVELGKNVDQPRNLAKSVTVE